MVSKDYIKFFDKQDQRGNLCLFALILGGRITGKKRRIEIDDIHLWKNGLVNNTSIRLIDPSATEMIDSPLLPNHHKDPFDRALIAQATNNNLSLVTKDEYIRKYYVPIFWI